MVFEVDRVDRMTTAATETTTTGEARARREVERVLVRLSPTTSHNLELLAAQRRTSKSAVVEDLIGRAVRDAEQAVTGKAA